MIAMFNRMKVKLIIYAAVASAIAAIFAYQYWQINKLQENVSILTENNVKLESAVETQKETIGQFETSLQQTIENNRVLNEQFSQANQKTEEIIQELNSYRGRLGNAALEKPTLIERRANDATDRLMREFTEATRGSQ